MNLKHITEERELNQRLSTSELLRKSKGVDNFLFLEGF